MKCLIAILVATAALLAPYSRAAAFFPQEPILPANQPPPELPPELAANQTNINTRYRIESVTLNNARPGRALALEFTRLAGRPYRTETIDAIERRLRAEFPGYEFSRKIEKGQKPEHLQVSFTLERRARSVAFDSPQISYHSRQNFSFALDASFQLGRTNNSIGFVTDNDERLERSSGIRGVTLLPLDPAKRYQFAFIAESYRTQWNDSTQRAAALQGLPTLYRTRQNIEPTLILRLLPGLEFRAGLGFQNLEMTFPAASNQAVHSFNSTLRYSKQWLLGSSGTKTLEAGYSLRAATKSLSSDFNYQRQIAETRLILASGNAEKSKSLLTLSTQFGNLSGQAPLLDRFVLGNSHTLRGYNRFDIAPLGASRLAHLSVDGRYHLFRLVYDTGTLWDEQRPKVLRHSAGFGLVINGITAMLAFPLRGGAVEPVFLAGINF
jgi:hypothetical protein